MSFEEMKLVRLSERKPTTSPWECVTVGMLIQRLSQIPQDKLVHVDLADHNGNVWKGDVDGVCVNDDCRLQAGLVHHQTPDETLELMSDEEEDEDDDWDDEPDEDEAEHELCVADIRNGEAARAMFDRIRDALADVLYHELDDAATAKVELAAEHLNRLLSAWDSRNRLEECYRRAILDRCCELHEYMIRSTGFQYVLGAEGALLTIGAAAQYAQPTAERKLLPVSWGYLVDPQYIGELKAEVEEQLFWS